MIEFIDEVDSSILGIKVSGRVTKGDYLKFVPRAEEIIEKYGRLHLLLEMGRVNWITPPAVWEDLKFDFKHVRDIGRLAIVGDEKWHSWFAKMAKPFVKGDARFFSSKQMTEAIEWLDEASQRDDQIQENAPSPRSKTTSRTTH